MIDDNIVFLDSKLESKTEILDFLIQNLKKANYLDKNGKNFENRILDREREVTTYMGNRIAIPHAKSNEVKHPFITFLRLKNPLEWNKGKSNFVNMIFMLGVPDKKNSIHLTVLSNLAKKLLNQEILKDLELTENKAKVVKILNEKE